MPFVGGYISANPTTPSAEEFISSTLNIGAKKSKSNRHRILYEKLNRNRIERKNKTQSSHHYNNVQATLSNATKANVASTKLNVASTLLPNTTTMLKQLATKLPVATTILLRHYCWCGLGFRQRRISCCRANGKLSYHIVTYHTRSSAIAEGPHDALS